MVVISTLFGVLLLFPYFVTLVLLVIMRRMGKAPATVIGLAADATTPVLFVTIYVISRTITGERLGVYIVAIALLIAIVRVVLERVRVKDFQIARLLRKTWRLYFLVLTASYIVLLFGGIIMKIVDYTS